MPVRPRPAAPRPRSAAPPPRSPAPASAADPSPREHYRDDLPSFARDFFPDLCRLPWSALHRHLFARRAAKTALLPPERRGALDCVLAPRGAAKSTLVSLVFPIHAALFGHDPYILLISATQRQASIRLRNLRAALLSNVALRKAFPEALEGWRPGSSRSIEVAGARIDAFSAGSEVRGVTHGGWRPTWIVLDDVESSARVLSPRYRENLWEWMLEVVENLGNGYTNIDLIGTLLHREALPARLAERPDAVARTFRSIEREADDAALWDEWRAKVCDLADPDRLANARAFFEERRERMLAGARVLWPEKESYYDLQLMRAVRGPSAFDKEKQNAPSAGADAVFAVERLARFSIEAGSPGGGRVVARPPTGVAFASPAPPETPLASMRVFGFLDPAAGGEAAGADFAAIVTVGADADGYLYVLDAWLHRAPPSEQIAAMFDLHARWRYSDFGVETNHFQKLLLDPIAAERDRRRRAGRPWDLPVRGVRHRANKRMRILSLEPLARNGWLAFAEGLPAAFMEQLGDFPDGRHDDGPDALEAAVALARGASPLSASPVRANRRAGPLGVY